MPSHLVRIFAVVTAMCRGTYYFLYGAVIWNQDNDMLPVVAVPSPGSDSIVLLEVVVIHVGTPAVVTSLPWPTANLVSIKQLSER